MQVDTEVEGSLSGYTTASLQTYRIFVAALSPSHSQLSNYESRGNPSSSPNDDSVIDNFQLTIASSDIASLECYLSSSAYPSSRVRRPLRLNGTSASLVLDHASSLLSINHDLFVRAVFSPHA